MKFAEIPQLMQAGSYEVNMPLGIVEERIYQWQRDHGLDLMPDFQRGHVWTEAQQTAFVEYFLQGGRSGMVIYFNKPSWRAPILNGYDDFVIVDGLQRLTALRRFVRGEIPAFRLRRNQFEDELEDAINHNELRFNINSLLTREEVLRWYYQMNSGGSPHSMAELTRVQGLLEQTSTSWNAYGVNRS